MLVKDLWPHSPLWIYHKAEDVTRIIYKYKLDGTFDVEKKDGLETKGATHLGVYRQVWRSDGAERLVHLTCECIGGIRMVQMWKEEKEMFVRDEIVKKLVGKQAKHDGSIPNVEYYAPHVQLHLEAGYLADDFSEEMDKRNVPASVPRAKYVDACLYNLPGGGKPTDPRINILCEDFLEGAETEYIKVRSGGEGMGVYELAFSSCKLGLTPLSSLVVLFTTLSLFKTRTVEQ